MQNRLVWQKAANRYSKAVSPTKNAKKKQFVTGNDILREKCFYFISNGFNFCFMLLKK